MKLTIDEVNSIIETANQGLNKALTDKVIAEQVNEIRIPVLGKNGRIEACYYEIIYQRTGVNWILTKIN